VPMGVVLAVDEPPSFARGGIMYTFMSGYHLRKKTDTWKTLPMSSIYLCPRARRLRPEAFVYAMVHELAHYVAPIGTDIDDKAYYHTDPSKYARLGPDDAYHNADSYARLAFDAVGQPDFHFGEG
jgi:hypothetical protein